jgi:peroxiredoxin Q/BCP
MRDNFPSLISKGYSIVGVSADSTKSHKKFIRKYSLPFPLISDENMSILKAYDAWGEKMLFGRRYEGILRKTYVISEEGRIEKIIEKVKTKDHSMQILKQITH